MRHLPPTVWLLGLLVLATACSADPSGQHGTAAPEAADVSTDVASDSGANHSPSDADAADTSQPATDASPRDTTNTDADLGTPASRCTVDTNSIRCTRHTDTYDSGHGNYESREVHWQVPVGRAPPEGWPAVVLFQGSFYSSEHYWEGERGSPMGLYFRARTLERLLDAGFAVITPEAHWNGTTYWDTNISPWSTMWESAPDHHFMLDIFEAIERGDFGSIDTERLFAAGISSGGYMTSRMAEAYPGKFEALAVLSASYCWCAGSACTMPAQMPDEHPPTLFVHGRLDTVVPLWTMSLYEDALSDDQVATKVIIDETAGHHWVERAPEAIVNWFDSYR